MPEVPRNEELRDQLNGKTLPELTEILKKGKSLHNTTDVDSVARALRAIEIMKFYELHPELALKTSKEHAVKPNSLIIGLEISRDERRNRISQRLADRLDQGMITEIERLLKDGINADDLIYYGLEYKFVTLYVLGKLTYDEMFSQLEIAIHQFAKRQMTWWRGMEKRGHKIHWIPYNIPSSDFIKEVKELLEPKT